MTKEKGDATQTQLVFGQAMLARRKRGRRSSLRPFGNGMLRGLFEVFYHRLEHLDVVVAVYVLVKAVCDTLCVTHLTEYSSVGRGDTLDSEGGAVGVVLNVVGSVAVKVDVLGCDLTVLDKLCYRLVCSEELTFTVGDRNVLNVTDVAKREPRRHIRCNARSYDLRLVARDVVEGKSRAGCIGIDDLTVGNESELDKSLEAVTDTAHKTVAVIKKLGDRALDLCTAEERGNELARSVRLVTAGEAAGNEDSLGLSDLLSEGLCASADTLFSEVVDNEDLGLSTCISYCLSRIELAVSTREYGNKNLRLCALNSGRASDL